MGIDLRLLPCEHWSDRNGQRPWGFSHSLFELGRVGESAWDAFQTMVKPHLVKMPDGHNISSFVGVLVSKGPHEGEPAYGTLRDANAYGEAYMFVEAQHLLPWIEEHFRYDGQRGDGPCGPYQTAIAAYLRALPPATKIILDWH